MKAKLFQTLWVFIAVLTFLGCQPSNTHVPDVVERQESYVTSSSVEDAFQVAVRGNVAPILVDAAEHKGVIKAAMDLQNDLMLVTGQTPDISYDSSLKAENVIIIGSLDESPLIQRLISSGKIDVADLEGKWEKYVIQKIENPTENIKQALLVIGSDKRGAIFGIYDLSQKIGVSPWNWWADVPPKKKSKIFVKPGRHTAGEPKVKYRGIFINDEAPSLANWAQENYGGFNHEFYSKVFELILRLKGNYLWPAMWGRSIYDDDPKSAEIANEWGVVLGTSHHEPLTRAHVEWRRYGEGPWNYNKNKEVLQEFWRTGMERMGQNESVVTVGMRGDGDEAMSESTEIGLLETIVADQRSIIEEVTGTPIEETPTMWALYKEVQDYYDRGMRVPDDVTLLLCDDNWGNIRKLPEYGDTLRAGGYGIYYHFDYVGGPRNYKWINTTQVSRVWEQMHMAYEYGVDQVWVVNVGDIKPMEYPISFFLDLAWNPEAISADQIEQYGINWASDQFGMEYAGEIAKILNQYTKYNSRRTPEMLSEKTYSLANFREFERVVEDYKRLATQAKSIGEKLPESYQSAYFQLVLYPVLASANLNEMYYTVALNQRNAVQGRSNTNELAARAKALFDRDTALVIQYHQLNDGKWNHQMDQAHIGYTYWQQPPFQVMPTVVDTLELTNDAWFAVAMEGSEEWWPDFDQPAVLPRFDSYHDQEYFIEIFNRGKKPYGFEIKDESGLLEFSKTKGSVQLEERVFVSVNWDKVSSIQSNGIFEIIGNGQSVEVEYALLKVDDDLSGYIENDGVVAIDAARPSKKIEKGGMKWLIVPDLGRIGSSIVASPSTAPSVPLSAASPYLQYDIFLAVSGNVKVKVYTPPTMNYHNDEGLSYAVSIDDQKPQIVNIHDEENFGNWNRIVGNHAAETYTSHEVSAGSHVLKIWYIDSRIPIQKIEVIRGEEKKSYLGAY